MDKAEKTRTLYSEGLAQNQPEKLEQALEIALDLRKTLDSIDNDKLASEINQYEHLDSGLNAHIYNLMNLLKRYDEILPFLEKTIRYLDNEKNPTLWRILGLLYLVQEKDIDKASEAWKKAIQLDPLTLERHPGLEIVHTYEALKASRRIVDWELLDYDLETGVFSVNLKVGQED
ncbi:MAG: hypothetical protein RTU30_00250 [Candidatus Thorarchaeota archaeon]